MHVTGYFHAYFRHMHVCMHASMHAPTEPMHAFIIIFKLLLLSFYYVHVYN